MAHPVTHTRRFWASLGLKPWVILALFIALLVVMPVLTVFYLAVSPTQDIWGHLLSTSLPRYFKNSVIIMTGTAAFTVIMGVATAWLVVMKEFFGRRAVEWLLLFPLAIPAYISAFIYVDLFEYAGPVQTQIRALFGFATPRDYYFPEIRSRGAAIFVLGLSLFPYVYLLARAAFREQSTRTLDVARTLGAGPWSNFIFVALPLARPAIAIGAAIVMMEALSDFGAVELFAVQTLTTGIFTTWLEGSNLGGAAQIASVIFVLVAILVVMERLGRKRAKFHQKGNLGQAPMRHRPKPFKQGLYLFICAFPIFFGFFLPLFQMINLSMGSSADWNAAALLSAGFRTIWVGLVVAMICVISAVTLVYGIRETGSRFLNLLSPVTTFGYAIPGAVLGIGVLIPLARLDHGLADAILALTGHDIGLVLTGTAGAIIIAQIIRFFALSYGSVDSAFGRFSPNLGAAARSLGQTQLGSLRKVQLPMMRSTLLVALLLVFVDSVKELPATLLLRPFGFETLATRIYTAASLEDFQNASVASLGVVIVGMIAVCVIAAASRK